MGELHFSRCAEWPWAWDVPYIQPAMDGAYRVSGPLRSETVGPRRLTRLSRWWSVKAPRAASSRRRTTGAAPSSRTAASCRPPPALPALCLVPGAWCRGAFRRQRLARCS
ncbi:DUF6193 family natural product biosynthesis protein [Streptomyces sp. NPDC058291]|uniref:DUF6193 family natural product biosynthesis protein n=1 Tax=Streptomyces sp. NPDC058291 TaxID=3346427 RepID=UPI0036E7EB02